MLSAPRVRDKRLPTGPLAGLADRLGAGAARLRPKRLRTFPPLLAARLAVSDLRREGNVPETEGRSSHGCIVRLSLTGPTGARDLISLIFLLGVAMFNSFYSFWVSLPAF